MVGREKKECVSELNLEESIIRRRKEKVDPRAIAISAIVITFSIRRFHNKFQITDFFLKKKNKDVTKCGLESNVIIVWL